MIKQIKLIIFYFYIFKKILKKKPSFNQKYYDLILPILFLKLNIKIFYK